MDVKELQREVETRMRNGETFSLQEIRKIMKETGLSYAQVIRRTKKLKKDMDLAEEQALREGKPFSRESYICQRMKG